MTTIFRYSVEQAPAASVDGSNMVQHDIKAQYSIDGETWQDVPGHHKTVSVPSCEVKTVMDMPDGTGPQIQAKNQAYKSLLVQCRNDYPIPLKSPPTSDWSLEGLDSYMTSYSAWLLERDSLNAEAATEASRLNAYVINVLGQNFPISFTL